MILALIILYVVTLVYLPITERFRNYSLIVLLQGLILMGVALLTLHGGHTAEMIVVVAETLVFKAVIVPYILFAIIRKTKMNRIVASGKSQFNSLMASIIALVASAAVTYWIADLGFNILIFGVSLYALLSGLLLITFRQRIFAHLVGFLIMENGVFLFSMAIGVEMPFLVNIAILLDILISVLLLGIFLSRIGDRLNVADADKLTSIKD